MYIIPGHLDKAGLLLLKESEWILGHVEELGEDEIIDSIHTLTVSLEGLHIDSTSLYKDRLKMWDTLNLARSALFTKQKEILDSGEEMSQRCSLMSREFICKMGEDLVKMCDKIEKHDLVNYQYGVMEDELIRGNAQCSAPTTIN